MCSNYLKSGSCKFGKKCFFAHTEWDLRKVLDNVKDASPEELDNYKTKACQNYWVDGVCEFGENCLYLHEFHRETRLPVFQEISDKLLRLNKFRLFLNNSSDSSLNDSSLSGESSENSASDNEFNSPITESPSRKTYLEIVKCCT